ncbi:hypothetical protein NST17_13560 [Caldifermentibacillus hisashii]|uniref:DUF2524 domain-containing protein n=1 Tax=Caldifermentibacillus hisashii TaxID=996558 RepID=A0ABU9JZE8_9BACI
MQERLLQYQQNNFDNKNSALINQTYSQIDYLEERSRERLEEIEHDAQSNCSRLKRLHNLS